MIDFQKIKPEDRELLSRYLMQSGERGCEYSFTNLYLWGKQRFAIVDGYLVLFSQFERRSVYPFPVGQGDIRPVLEALMADARERGVLFRVTSLSAEGCMTLEELYPGRFQFYPDRNSCDYVYGIHDLADLAGRRFQKKRNHVNRFWQSHPQCRVEPISPENLDAVREMVELWYQQKLEQDPHSDFHLEQMALKRAFAHMEELGLEGLALVEDGKLLAMTMGSPLSEDTFDIHFEKALEDGAYAAINQAFAKYLREKYPRLAWLNREDDMGLPGLRKAKLSYYPDRLITKFWAYLTEEEDDH